MSVDIPRGTLVRSRVGLDSALQAALDRQLTGYARIEPDSLLAHSEQGVVTFDTGVPVTAYCETGDSRGVDALATLAGPGPCSVELYKLPKGTLEEVHKTSAFSVPPGGPAEELADNAALADRTRKQAPDGVTAGQAGESALASFLEDEERIAAIQAEARAEAKERAEEWGLDEELSE